MNGHGDLTAAAIDRATLRFRTRNTNAVHQMFAPDRGGCAVACSVGLERFCNRIIAEFGVELRGGVVPTASKSACGTGQELG